MWWTLLSLLMGFTSPRLGTVSAPEPEVIVEERSGGGRRHMPEGPGAARGHLPADIDPVKDQPMKPELPAGLRDGRRKQLP